MIRVFRLVTNTSKYKYVYPENDKDWSKLHTDCSKRLDSWVPPPIYFYEPLKEEGDFFNARGDTLISTSRATKALQYHLEAAGEILPLPFEGTCFYLTNITECVNCLDQQATVWRYGTITGARIRIQQYVFHPNRFSDSALFKIPETHKSEILLVEGLEENPEDNFRNIIEREGLKGLQFQQLWEYDKE